LVSFFASFASFAVKGFARSALIRGKPVLLFPITAITRDVGDDGDLPT